MLKSTFSLTYGSRQSGTRNGDLVIRALHCIFRRLTSVSRGRNVNIRPDDLHKAENFEAEKLSTEDAMNCYTPFWMVTAAFRLPEARPYRHLCRWQQLGEQWKGLCALWQWNELTLIFGAVLRFDLRDIIGTIWDYRVHVVPLAS